MRWVGLGRPTNNLRDLDPPYVNNLGWQKLILGEFRMGTWVVAYDVTQDSRRAKIARLLEAKGIRLQKSVFLVQAPPRNVRRLVRELGGLIDTKTDRVCAWPLLPSWQLEQLCFPESAAPLQDSFVIA